MDEIYLLHRHFCNQKSHSYLIRHEAYVSSGPAPPGGGFIPWGLPFLSGCLFLLKFHVEGRQHIVDPIPSLPDPPGGKVRPLHPPVVLVSTGSSLPPLVAQLRGPR
ncbi:hypothetical protein Zmor_021487 [Zophobas morio]|uniref:Uncharacterized protein n=1 Tax=Zophobas morio TaxID=2755281 RepID=A0AA38MB15_9CUCU|nr:hypothetical protein Zmor_021487 [Zophobas morio]